MNKIYMNKYRLEKISSEHDLSQGTSLLVFQEFVLCSMDDLHLLGFPMQL